MLVLILQFILVQGSFELFLIGVLDYTFELVGFGIWLFHSGNPTNDTTYGSEGWINLKYIEPKAFFFFILFIIFIILK